MTCGSLRCQRSGGSTRLSPWHHPFRYTLGASRWESIPLPFEGDDFFSAHVAYAGTFGHNIPSVFWNYMNRQPTDWLFAFGHPISEPVWVRTRIGGVKQWVLTQLFERRALTYTSGNAPEWQVEMGNVGQHAYAWRYGADPDNPPWTAPLPGTAR